MKSTLTLKMLQKSGPIGLAITLIIENKVNLELNIS